MTMETSNGAPTPRRRALCVGIDNYVTRPLYGCVADARTWAEVLAARGFETELLLDADATHERILSTLRAMIAASRAGDVLAFQYAGHGTLLPDVDADEQGDDTPAQDEALCVANHATGRYVVDDDLATVIAELPPGVNLTCFVDCCHSGSISRCADDEEPERSRFLPATPEMVEAHLAFRQNAAAPPPPPRGEMREVTYSACRSCEVAYETGGHGEFTVRATAILRQPTPGLTNEGFLRAVLAAFGENRRQTPELHCAPAARGQLFLEPPEEPRVSRGGAEERGGRGEQRGDSAVVEPPPIEPTPRC
jgi:hypothetical protein